nr:hypothetical protein [Actinopolyspora alba]
MNTMDFSSLPRLGVVVPPENPTVEPEFTRLAGDIMRVYSSRFPLVVGEELQQVLHAWNVALPEILSNFGSLELDATVVACSASHYLLDPEGDRDFCDQLSGRLGFPVQSSTQAILACCASLGITELTLVSPYEPWLTELSRSFWEKAGITVDRVIPVPAGDRFDPYSVTTDKIVEEVSGGDIDDDGPLLFTGTGMFTLEALDQLSRRTDRVLLTSNLASVWWGLKVTALPHEESELHPLLRRLRPER